MGMYNVISDLQLFGSNLNVPRHVLDESYRLYLIAKNKGLTQGRDTTKSLACLVYHISKREGYPILMEELSILTGVKSKSLFRTYKNIKRLMQLDNELLQPETLVYKLNNDLGLSADMLTHAVKICGKLKNKTNNPKTIAATALYMSARTVYSLKELSRKTGVSKKAIKTLSTFSK